MRKILFTLALCVLLVSAQAEGLPRRGNFGVPLRAVPEDVRKGLKLGPQEALEVTVEANGLKPGDLIVGVAAPDGRKDLRFKAFAEFNELIRAWTDKPKALVLVKRKDGEAWKESRFELVVQPKPADIGDTYETVYSDVVSRGYRVRVIFTRPKTPGRHPVFFWMQGINVSSIDFPLTTKNYMAPFLKVFADDGYVTVRVEKPGIGDSEGGPARLVGFDEEHEIYRAALKALGEQPFVDRNRVFVFGHSMGGCHAPLACRDFPVKGIVSYGTVSNSWLEWEVRAPRVQSPLGGKSLAEVDKEVRLLTQFYSYLFTEKRPVDWIKKNRSELKTTCDENSPDGVMLGERTVKYMQEVNDRNYCEAWSKLGKTRVLALFGDNDWISLREDQTQVADAVNAANPGMAEFRTVEGCDHAFFKSSSMKDSYSRWGKGGQEFNPEVVRVVKDWIAKLKD